MPMINSAAVRREMIRRGFGVKALSELAKIPMKTISRISRSDSEIFLPTLSRLAKALQIEDPEILLKRGD